MKGKRYRGHKPSSGRRPARPAHPENLLVRRWPGEASRYFSFAGLVLITLCIAVIYWQTVSVPTIDYEDTFYLAHSPYVHVSRPFLLLGAVWDEPYFANFHPVTTSTWIVDRALSDPNKYFDAVPFRIAHLVYAISGACLLMLLFRRLGLPRLVAALGGIVYVVHPIHTEVVAWLSARKDLISFIFILLSLLVWLRARNAITPNQWRLRYGFAILLALLAVLSKPIAVIIPALFIAFEFCSEPHEGVTRWRWSERSRHLLVTRVFAMTAIFFVAGGGFAWIFRIFLGRNAMHGGWLILLVLGLVLPMLGAAPSEAELTDFRSGRNSGIRVMAAPMVALSAVFGACSAWTFWAQEQVGAIKGGLTLLPTLNLTFDAMLAYAGKTFLPTSMSATYHWSSYPYLSLRGIFGFTLVVLAVWIAMRLAGSADCDRRLVAFGILWWLIALVPVSNLIPTSTKMADRYLFVPTAGAILALLAAAVIYCGSSRRRQWSVCSAMILIVISFVLWSYSRTEVWCGKTTLWRGKTQPDLSLWTDAARTDPDDTLALTSLGLAYLRLNPPDADAALVQLNRALVISEANQSKIAGDKQLILTPIYDALGDGYLAKSSQLTTAGIGTSAWQERKAAYSAAAKYFELACFNPSGFASSDSRVCGGLAQAFAGQAQMEAQELAAAPRDQEPSIVRERDRLRARAEDAIRRAKEILISGNVRAMDPNYRSIFLEAGNIFFGREVGASNDGEKTDSYFQALLRYKEAAARFPDDARPFLYEGLCYERLTAIARSPEEKEQQFALAEATLREALSLDADAADYSSALPYRALASVYSHVGDYRSALNALKGAREADPSAASSDLDSQIRSVEQYLAAKESGNSESIGTR